MTEEALHRAPDLAQVVCELSLARDLDSIMRIVREAARGVAGADGATFILREDDQCYYADEAAMEPLWKGRRFPLSQCISGWVMLHGVPAAISNIYADDRIPGDLYRATFVKSLFMVPIRSAEPLGAIGVYWAHQHQPEPEEQRCLCAIADTTAVALENIRVHARLERHIATLGDERQRLAGVLEGTRAGAWEWNVQTGEVIIDTRWAQLVGYVPDELSPITIQTWNALVHPEDLVRSKALLRKHFSAECDYYECECRMKHKDGRWIWVISRGKVLSRTGEGKPLRMFGTHADITERKRTELKIEQLNRVMAGIRNVNQLITREKQPEKLLDEACRLLCESQGFHNVWIAAFESVEAESLNDGPAPSIAACFGYGFDGELAAMRSRLMEGTIPACALQALQRREVYEVSDPNRVCGDCPLASTYQGSSGLTVRLSHNNRVYGWLCVSAPSEYAGDAEERSLLQEVAEDLGLALYSAETEKRRGSAERAYADMVAATTDAVIGCDMHGAILLFNHGAERLFGCDAAEALGEPVSRFCPPELLDEQLRLLQCAREKGSVGPFETRRLTAAGKPVHVETTITLRRDDDGAPAGFVGILRDITERKKAVEEMLLLQFSLENASVGVFRLRPDGTFVYANKQARKSLGMTQEELLAATVADIDPNFPAQARADQWRKLKEHGSLTFETEHRDKQGNVFPVEVTDHYFRYESQEYEFAFARDITERKRAERALRESERDLRRAQGIAKIGSWRFDLNKGMVVASDEARSIYGLPDTALSIEQVQKIPLPRYRSRLDEELRNLVERGRPYTIEFVIRRPTDNALRHIHSVAEYDAGQNVVLGIVHDITERKMTEKARWESENRFRSFVENANDVVYALSPEGIFTYISPNWLDFMGEPAEHVIGKSFEPIVHPEDVARCREFLDLVMTTGEKQSSVEYRVRHADGSWRWHVSNGAALFDNDGAVTGYIGIARDVTEHKAMEKTLRENEAFLQAALNNSHAGIAIADAPDGKLRYVNDAALRIRGASRKEVVQGIGIQRYVESWRICHLDGTPYRNDEPPLARAILFGETGSKEFIIKREDGADRIVWANAAPIYDGEGKVAAGIVVFLDITETRRLNERLRQTEKMESIGALAGGIAHDFNNILGAIIGYADMSLYEVQPDSRLAKNLHRILQAGDRAKHLVRQILNFSRRGAEERTPQYLRPVIKEVVELLRASLPSSIRIESSLAQSVEPVLANPTQIHEIVMNLCTNAAHAMRDEKGLLQVLYEERECDRAIEGDAGVAPPGLYSIITVRDNGRGMSPGVLERIFEPFFTTKTQGEGTGMGLAVVFGIVQSHGGTITVESEPGAGTTFQVYLPACEHDSAEDAPNEDTPVQCGEERILLVDDEQVIAEMANDLLTNLGYNVTVFNEPVLALEAFAKNTDSFDLVITDQTMPGLSGMEFAREIRTISAGIPVILCTGYSNLVDEERALAAGINGFLTKPFRRRVIAHTIRTVLDRKGRG